LTYLFILALKTNLQNITDQRIGNDDFYSNFFCSDCQDHWNSIPPGLEASSIISPDGTGAIGIESLRDWKHPPSSPRMGPGLLDLNASSIVILLNHTQCLFVPASILICEHLRNLRETVFLFPADPADLRRTNQIRLDNNILSSWRFGDVFNSLISFVSLRVHFVFLSGKKEININQT